MCTCMCVWRYLNQFVCVVCIFISLLLQLLLLFVKRKYQNHCPSCVKIWLLSQIRIVLWFFLLVEFLAHGHFFTALKPETFMTIWIEIGFQKAKRNFIYQKKKTNVWKFVGACKKNGSTKFSLYGQFACAWADIFDFDAYKWTFEKVVVIS